MDLAILFGIVILIVIAKLLEWKSKSDAKKIVTRIHENTRKKFGR